MAALYSATLDELRVEQANRQQAGAIRLDGVGKLKQLPHRGVYLGERTVSGEFHCPPSR
jgi:hypothetical protein